MRMDVADQGKVVVLAMAAGSLGSSQGGGEGFLSYAQHRCRNCYEMLSM